jgi:hypothetical protein
MADVDRYKFSYQEVATALIKQQGLHEGIWNIALEFGLGAIMGGPSLEQAVPTAMVPVVSIGLSKVDKESNTAVDASRVNPAKVSLKGTARGSASASGRLQAK